MDICIHDHPLHRSQSCGNVGARVLGGTDIAAALSTLRRVVYTVSLASTAPADSRLGGHVVNSQIQRDIFILDRMAGNCRQLAVSCIAMPTVMRPDASVTASINFGGAQLILAAATLYHEDYVPTAWQTVLVYWAALIGAFMINLFFNR